MNNIPISNKIPELDIAIKAAEEAGSEEFPPFYRLVLKSLEQD